MRCKENALIPRTRSTRFETISTQTMACGIIGRYRRRGSIRLAELRANRKRVRYKDCDTWNLQQVARTDSLPAAADRIRAHDLPGSHDRSTLRLRLQWPPRLK